MQWPQGPGTCNLRGGAAAGLPASQRLILLTRLTLFFHIFSIFSLPYSFPILSHPFPIWNCSSAYRQSRPVVRQRSAKWQTWKGNCKQSMPQTFGLFWIILLPYFGIFWILLGLMLRQLILYGGRLTEEKSRTSLIYLHNSEHLSLSLSIYIYILHWDFNQHQIGWPPFTFLKMVSLRQELKLGDPNLVKYVPIFQIWWESKLYSYKML